MANMFSTPKVSTPSVPPPSPIPEVAEEDVDIARRRISRRRGFRKTIITGMLTPENTGKKTTLG